MKTIHRSIFRELLVTFLLGLFAFNFVLITEKILRLTKVLASVGASLGDMAMMVFYLQPTLTLLTTPMALLIAVLVTYGRLNADSELVVMRSCGMSFRDMARPVFLLGTGCFLMGSLVSFYLAPAGAGNLREAVSDVIARRAPYAIEEGIFNITFRDVVIYVDKKTGDDNLKGIFMYDTRKKGRPVTMHAEEGRVSSSGNGSVSLSLSNGHIYFVEGTSSTDLSFGRYNMHIPFTAKSVSKRHDEMAPFEILREAKAAPPPQRYKLLLEFHRRLSMPALCLILMFLGPPLALMSGRTGKLGGLALGLLVFAVYYAMLVYAENLVRSGMLPHYLGAWAPAMILGMFSLWMFRREEAK